MTTVCRPDQLPPQSLDAERGLLGSILRDNQSFDDIAGIVTAESFYADAHQKLYRIIAENLRAGRPVDTVILFEALKRRKQLADVGGAEYLAELWDAAPTAANAVYYANLIAEKAGARSLIHGCTEIIRDAHDGVGSFEALRVKAERLLGDTASPFRPSLRWLDDVLASTVSRIDERCRPGGDTGLQTGIHRLDEMLGGLHAGELVCIAGRPGDGKSALAAMVAENVARAGGGKPVLFLTLEMLAEEIAERLLVRESGVDGWRVKKGRLREEDGRAMIDAQKRLRGLPVVFDDGSDITLSRAASMARRVHRQHGLALIVLDYLQLVEAENKQLRRHEQVGAVSRGLKMLAKELRVPVLVLAQLNRESESDSRPPRLSDIRESGAVEQDSDVVACLHRPARPAGSEEPVPGELTPIELLVLKNRGGPRGAIPLLFDGPRFRFVEDLPT